MSYELKGLNIVLAIAIGHTDYVAQPNPGALPAASTPIDVVTPIYEEWRRGRSVDLTLPLMRPPIPLPTLNRSFPVFLAEPIVPGVSTSIELPSVVLVSVLLRNGATVQQPSLSPIECANIPSYEM